VEGRGVFACSTEHFQLVGEGVHRVHARAKGILHISRLLGDLEVLRRVETAAIAGIARTRLQRLELKILAKVLLHSTIILNRRLVRNEAIDLADEVIADCGGTLRWPTQLLYLVFLVCCQLESFFLDRLILHKALAMRNAKWIRVLQARYDWIGRSLLGDFDVWRVKRHLYQILLQPFIDLNQWGLVQDGVLEVSNSFSRLAHLFWLFLCQDR